MRTCYGFITLLLILALTTACGKADMEPEKPKKEDVSAIIASAERTVLTSRNRDSLEKAYFELKAVRDPDKRDFATEAMFSKICYYYGRETEEGNEKDRIWQSGIDAGKIASRLEPQRPEGFYWAGANLSALSRKNPLTTGIKSTQELRDLAGQSVKIDPAFENGGALEILAQIELFTGLVGGSPKKAVGFLEQAVRYDSRDGSIRLALAEAYLLSRRTDDARRVLREIVEMSPDPNFKQEHEVAVAKARRLLERRL